MEKKPPALAITDPHVHNTKAITVAGLVIASPICGAQIIATIAEIGAMLYTNNSDQVVGESA
jgi:hypothetical protein